MSLNLEKSDTNVTKNIKLMTDPRYMKHCCEDLRKTMLSKKLSNASLIIGSKNDKNQ